MSEVHKVTIQIRAPRGTFHGEIAEGWYCVVDNAVVMTDLDGKPLGTKHNLSPGEDARLVACRLVRQRRRGSSSVSGFTHKTAYPKLNY
jgi:hypothetical protein